MKVYLVCAVSVTTILALVAVEVVWAHGEPVIAVEPTVVPAGGSITVTGTEMEPGEIFAITLEGLAGSIPLGEATAMGEGEEGGFTATVTIPSHVAPGSYTINAATEESESTQADLTVTEPPAEASAAPATMQEPTGEEHLLDRTKPAGETITVIVAALTGLVLGFWLIRRH